MKCIRAIILLGIAMMLLFPFVEGQTLEIDLLEARLEFAGDVEKSKIIRRLINLHEYSDIDKSLTFIDQAIALGAINQDSLPLAQFMRNKCQFLSRKGKFQEVYPLLLPWLTWCRKNSTRELGHMLTLIGLSDIMQGNYSGALQYFTRCLAIPGETGIPLSTQLNNIGLVYYKLNDHKKAVYFFSGRFPQVLTGDPFEECNCYILGLAYGEMGQFTTAEYLIRSGLELCSGNDVNPFIGGYFSLGQVMFRSGRLAESEFALTEALALAKREGDSRHSAECSAYLAKVFLKTSRRNEALWILKKCEIVCLRYGYKEILLDCYQTMVMLFQATGAVDQSAKYQSSATEIISDLHNYEVINKLASVEVEWRAIQNRILFRSQKERTAIQTDIARVQKSISYALSAFCFLLAILIILLCIGYRYRIRIHSKLVLLEVRRKRALDEAHLIQQRTTEFQMLDISARLKTVSATISLAIDKPIGSTIQKSRSEIDNLIRKLHDLICDRSADPKIVAR